MSFWYQNGIGRTVFIANYTLLRSRNRSWGQGRRACGSVLLFLLGVSTFCFLVSSFLRFLLSSFLCFFISSRLCFFVSSFLHFLVSSLLHFLVSPCVFTKLKTFFDTHPAFLFLPAFLPAFLPSFLLLLLELFVDTRIFDPPKVSFWHLSPLCRCHSTSKRWTCITHVGVSRISLISIDFFTKILRNLKTSIFGILRPISLIFLNFPQLWWWSDIAEEVMLHWTNRLFKLWHDMCRSFLWGMSGGHWHSNEIYIGDSTHKYTWLLPQ